MVGGGLGPAEKSGLSEQGRREATALWGLAGLAEATGPPKEPGPTGSVLIQPLATKCAAGRAPTHFLRLPNKLGSQNNGPVFSRVWRLDAGDQGPCRAALR